MGCDPSAADSVGCGPRTPQKYGAGIQEPVGLETDLLRTWHGATMNFEALSLALGGLGLLLLGMGMMTDGLKAAAGDALLRLLERTTRTRARAAFGGFALTALVQSSSAVIVATLGFVNAGMLRLRQAAWIVFGSNVGTTMTAWIVAFIGLKIRVEGVALPLIGAGMLLRLLRGQSRGGHIGTCLAGFGVLFLGLGLLRDAFADATDWIPVEQLGAAGALGIVLGVVFGTVLTALIQSSSAALAIILTASVSGVLSPLLAASMVIGANIGTTVTSALASIGATSNARRLAAAHAGANAITAVVALALLPLLWWLSQALLPGPGTGEGAGDLSTALALFHTLFNLLGLGLMVVFADPMLRFIERRIRRPERVSSAPRYLDETALSVPAAALGAMHAELKRIFKQLLARGRQLIDAQTPPPEEDIHTEPLLQAVAEFGARAGAQALGAADADRYLALNRAREELLALRLQLRALQAAPAAHREAALATELEGPWLTLTLSGELKLLDEHAREKLRRKVRRLRRRRRKALLEQIRSGQITAEQASGQLQLAATLEEAAYHVLHVTDILYPAAPLLDAAEDTARAAS